MEQAQETLLVAFKHLDAVATGLSYTMDVHVSAFFSRAIACNWSCQNATLEDCRCSCLGLGHKGGNGYLATMTPTGSFILDQEETEVQYFVPKR